MGGQFDYLSGKKKSVKSDQIFGKWLKFLPTNIFADFFFLPTKIFTKQQILPTNIFYSKDSIFHEFVQ